MNELLVNWLHSGDKYLLRLVLPRETYLFLRAEKQLGFDYLYCQRQYSSDGLRRKDSFQYAGLYCAADGLIYDADYALTHMDGADKTLQCQKDKKGTEEREKWCQAERFEIQAEVRKRHRKETDEKVCQEKVYKTEKLCYSIKEADDALG